MRGASRFLVALGLPGEWGRRAITRRACSGGGWADRDDQDCRLVGAEGRSITFLEMRDLVGDGASTTVAEMTQPEPVLTCDFDETADGPMLYLVARSRQGVLTLLSLFRELSQAPAGTVINLADIDDVAFTSEIGGFDLCVSKDERGRNLVHNGDRRFVWWGSNYEWESVMLLAEPLWHGGFQHLTSMQPHVDAEVELSVGRGSRHTPTPSALDVGEIREHYLIERFVEDAVRPDCGERFLKRLLDARASSAMRSEFNFNVVEVGVDWEQQTVRITDVLAADSQIELSLDQLMQIVLGSGQDSSGSPTME